MQDARHQCLIRDALLACFDLKAIEIVLSNTQRHSPGLCDLPKERLNAAFFRLHVGISPHSPASTVLSISRSSSSSATEGAGSRGMAAIGLLGLRVPLGIPLFLLLYVLFCHVPTGDDSFQRQFFPCDFCPHSRQSEAWGERSIITMHCHQAPWATGLALPGPSQHVVIRVATTYRSN